MKKQELLSILITLGVGFIAGAFLYLNVFTEMIQPDGDLETIEELEEFSITSQAYGGCRTDCPAFRVNADGSYRYQYVPTVGAQPILRSGTLPLRLQSELKRELDSRSLVAQSQSANRTNCASATDGVDIEYRVELTGNLYVLDSCRTAIDGQSDMWRALSALWTYFTQVSAENQ